MPSTNLSFEQVIQGVKDVVGEIQSKFDKPDDDFWPTAVFQHEGGGTVVPMEFPNDAAKDVWANVFIPYAITTLDAWMVVLVQSVWTLSLPRDEDESIEDARSRWEAGEIVMPSQHPDRKEAVVLTAVSADQIQVWWAEIHRSEDAPPTLGEWDLYSDKQGEFAGRFIDPLVAVLQERENE